MLFYEDCSLKMSCQSASMQLHSPSIFRHVGMAVVGSQHGLNSNAHASLENFRFRVLLDFVRNRWCHVDLRTDAVPAVTVNNVHIVLFRYSFNRSSDVVSGLASFRYSASSFERLSGSSYQFASRRARAAKFAFLINGSDENGQSA